MNTRAGSNQQFPLGLRLVFGLVAIGKFMDDAPWSQPDPLRVATSCTGALLFGLLAIFGNKPGWSRTVTMAVAIVYAVLVFGRLFNFAT
jgi:hypothetical protein